MQTYFTHITHEHNQIFVKNNRVFCLINQNLHNRFIFTYLTFKNMTSKA